MNLFDCTTPKFGEDFTALLEHKNIKINRIVSSDTAEPKEYCQEEDEWIVVLKGKATLQIAHSTKTLSKGDTLFIPAKTPHSVLSTTHGTMWLTVHIF